MSGGGKGGSSTSQTQIPAWLENAAQSNLARADQLSQIGYTPYYGPDVAALSPMQVAAMQGTNQAASAFGMGGGDAMAGMPAPHTFAGGVQGYSSAPLFQQSLDALAAARPGQFAALQAPFINPVTGAEPAAPFGSSNGVGDGRGGGRGVPGTPRMGMWRPYSGGSSDRSAAETAAMMVGSSRTSGGGTGSFGLPDPMSGRFAGTNLPGIGGQVVNAVTRSATGGGSGSSGMGGGK